MKTFELTKQHIKLLRLANVIWEDIETGAPAIDPKRPYGNSYVPGDMHEILTGERAEDELTALTDDQEREYLNLHRELETALQIVLHTGSFKPGKYKADDYRNDWKRL